MALASAKASWRPISRTNSGEHQKVSASWSISNTPAWAAPSASFSRRALTRDSSIRPRTCCSTRSAASRASASSVMSWTRPMHREALAAGLGAVGGAEGAPAPVAAAAAGTRRRPGRRRAGPPGPGSSPAPGHRDGRASKKRSGTDQGLGIEPGRGAERRRPGDRPARLQAEDADAGERQQLDGRPGRPRPLPAARTRARLRRRSPPSSPSPRARPGRVRQRVKIGFARRRAQPSRTRYQATTAIVALARLGSWPGRDRRRPSPQCEPDDRRPSVRTDVHDGQTAHGSS